VLLFPVFPLEYQWYKDGAAIDGATTKKYTIDDATEDSSGAYKVVVINELGEISSNEANVLVTLTNTVGYVGEGGKVTLDVSRDMIRKQMTIIASWTFSSIGQAECARFVADRKIDVDALFTHRWKLDQAEEAYQLFDQQTTGKGVFLS